MTSMLESIFTRKTIFLMVLSAIVGFSVNYFSTKLANDKLLHTLTAQYNAILQAQQTVRGSESQVLNIKKMQLEAQISLLSKN